jgi:formylglycine-generating enzyme required for sulfatase activity
VGSKSCPDQWGVEDLIGNVWEWTSSEVSVYPGSKLAVDAHDKPLFMVRGGSYFDKSSGKNAISSTFRTPLAVDSREQTVGFRLVSEQ